MKYSRVNVVKNELFGDSYRSNVDRPGQHYTLLRENGSQIYILKSQGFIFFGTANILFNKIKNRVINPRLSAIHYMVLSFRLVNGLDSSIVQSFSKLKQLAIAQKITIVFTDLSPSIQHQFEKADFLMQKDDNFKLFSELDHGVEWCENRILIDEDASTLNGNETLHKQLKQLFADPDHIDVFAQHLEIKKITKNDYLMRQGDQTKDIYFIESGQVTILLQLDDNKTVRLKTMGPGAIVAEIGLYLGVPRSATVVADQPSILYRLTVESLEKLSSQNPKIASAFHKSMACMPAERLTDTNKMVEALFN